MEKDLLRKSGLWPEKKRGRLAVKWLLLIGILLTSWQQMAADDDPNTVIDNKDQYVINSFGDGSVSITVPVYDADGYDKHTSAAAIYVTVNNTETKIFDYNSWLINSTSNPGGHVRFNVTCLYGIGFCGDTQLGKEISQFAINTHPETEPYLMKVMWYCPGNMAGANVSFRIEAAFERNDGADPDPVNFTGLKDITIKNFSTPTVNTPTLSTTKAGYFDVTYTAQGPVGVIWGNEGEVGVSGNTGTHQIPISDETRNYPVAVRYRLNAYSLTDLYTTTTTIPAFHQPLDFKAEDTSGGNTKLTWSIATTGKDNCIAGDQFEVQRATNPEFSAPKAVGNVNFDKETTKYELIDNTGEENLNGTVYYRIRRTKQLASGWSWEYVKKCSIQKSMSHCHINTLTAVQEKNTDNGIKVKVAWTLDAEATNKVWTTGSRIILKQKNVTDGTITDIPVTKQDITNGYIINELYVTCKEYKYVAYVQPGNSKYKAQEELEATYTEGEIKPVFIGSIKSLTASKGYYPSRTDLFWETDGKPIDRFSVEWRVYDASQKDENANFTTLPNGVITVIPEQTNYSLVDDRGNPGVVYEYRVVGITSCIGKQERRPSAIIRGFCSPTGIVSGRITYSYGDAVPGVDVLLSSKELLAGQSVKFAGGENSYLQTDSAISTPTHLTIQAYVKPTGTTNQTATIVEAGCYRLGLKEGKAAFSANGGTSWTVTDADALPTASFTQLTAVYDGASFNIYVGGKLKKTYTATGLVGEAGNAKVIIGKSYTGYVDEVRLWNKGLTAVEVTQTYNRLLAGNESGLMAYWRLNDPVTDEFYDISYSSGNYNAHHGKIHSAELKTGSEEYPTEQQLALRGLTDQSGNYSVSGIPYQGNGTAYTLTPTHSIFSFDPKERNVTIGPSAVTMSDIDFKNKTAIKVEGYVFYENSSIPVVGATFEVNDQPVVSNGVFVTSATDGKFAFSVPVGEQTVRVVKANHRFKQDGLLLDSEGINLNYQHNMANVRFWDQTKVKLIGRMAGGTVEQNKPLGFSLSKNNLGDAPTLVLTLEGDATSEIYDKDGVYEDGVIDKTPPEKMDSTMVHWNHTYDNGVSYQQKQIVITPDAETGEYEAWLYPVKYKVTAATATGWEGLLPEAAPVVNLENVFTEQTSEYTDEKKAQTYRLIYNEKYSLIHRVSPTISYKQGNVGGATTDYFGLLNTTIPDIKGLNPPDTLTLYDKTTKEYLFKDTKNQGLPVFSVGTWGFHIEATEDYAYNGTKGGESGKIDRVPTQGGEVSIANAFNQNAAPQKVLLNDQGRLYVPVKMDNPSFAKNNYGSLAISVTINNQTYNAPTLTGLLLGADPQTDGLDFVTAGPITLLNILRDPPGSHSYTWWESGQSYSYYTKNMSGFTNAGTESVTTKLGVKTAVGIGIGSMVLTETEMENNIQASINHEETTNHPDARTMTVTTNSRYQTSDETLNVGSAADVFIGFSNNLYYGAVKEIELLDKDTYNSKSGTKEVYATATKDNNTYYICMGKNLNVSVSGSTLFSYPKMHIENIVVPNLETLRNNMLYTPDAITESDAQAMATAQKRMIYRSKVSKDNKTFGSVGSYKIFIPSSGIPEEEIEDKFLGQFLGRPTTVKDGTPDSVAMYNNAIKEWVRVLKQNEDEKMEAIKQADVVERNRSFHASAPVEYTESYEMAKENGYSFEFTATAGIAAEIGFAIGGVGLVTTIDQQFGGVGADEQNSTEGNTASSGFILADEGDFDYISVDILRAAPVDTTFKNKWDKMYTELKDFNNQGDIKPDKLAKCVQYGNFIFKTRGGATACPYEAAEYTQYQDGTQNLLNEATMQIERPSLEVAKPVVTNVPSDQAAVYNLKLMNDSQVSGATAIFTIAIVDAANQKGAKFSIDGVPLGEGRGIEVPYGEVLNKVLEVRRGTEYDYEDLALVLKSQCQSDPTDNQADIADTVYISAHFIPSSSDINIKNPTDKWTFNTQASQDSTSGKYYMPLMIDGFDVNFTGFDHVEIQYKPSSGSDKDWTNICSFYNDSALYKAASGVKEMLDGPTINTRFYGAEDQKYDIRAVTFSKVGNKFVTKSSPIISGMKDTKRPVTFGNIHPTDGVLGIEDEIRLNFNEEIAEGYMTDVKNFEVTAIRNGSQGDHSTSLTFEGKAAYLATQSERNLTNKDLTVEMWVLPATLGQEMTLFSHGTSANSLDLSIGADKSIKVRIGDKVYTSRPIDFKTTDWAHVAMSYKASNRQLSAYFGGIEVIAGVEAESYTGVGPMVFGRDMKGGNFFAGKMHEVRVWNKVVSSNNIVANKLTIYTGRESGMLGYYPMNEGKGDRVSDKSQGATAWIYGAEWSTLDGMSVAFKGDTIVAVNATRIPLTDEKDYTLQFWFKAEPGQKEAALVSNGKGVEAENNTSYNKVFVGFADGRLVFRNNDHEEVLTGNWLDNSWHHFAISVNRNAGNAQIFMDGALNTYFDAGKLGGFTGTNVYLGARLWTEASQMVSHTDMHLKGQVDELQLWNMALPSSVIADKYNVCPKGTEMGLMMYLPFSKYIRNSANVQELVYSGEDLVTDSTLVANGGKKLASAEKAPVRAKGPEVSIPFTFVVNKDALVINLMDTPEALEKTVVNFTVKDVSDLNGNLMQSPVTWTAYVNRNQLKWNQTSVTKEKKLYAPMTFTVDVENRGGTEKNFTIEGLPAWLKADPGYGTVGPLGRQTILFTINEGTNVGRYDEVVYVKGDNNVSEALPITLKVFDQQPDWTVDPANFKYNMNIYGKLRVNKLFSADTEDMIAVFDGDRCVGYANNQYADKNDMWYVFLTVYANEVRSSEALTFRVWDASTGTVYDAYCDSPVVFSSNSVVGTASTPVIFDAEERVVQNINLKEGWNWVSFHVKSDAPDLATILKNTMLQGDEQVKDETTGCFAAYDKVSKKWLGDPIIFNNKSMFLIQSSVAQRLSVSGIAIKEKKELTIPVAKNWNYISYLPMNSLPVGEALSGYTAREGDIIKSQSAFSMYGLKTGWLGSLTYMEPGKGYMLLNKGESTSLAYPDMMGGNDLRSTALMTRMGDPLLNETGYVDGRLMQTCLLWQRLRKAYRCMQATNCRRM